MLFSTCSLFKAITYIFCISFQLPLSFCKQMDLIKKIIFFQCSSKNFFFCCAEHQLWQIDVKNIQREVTLDYFLPVITHFHKSQKLVHWKNRVFLTHVDNKRIFLVYFQLEMHFYSNIQNFLEKLTSLIQICKPISKEKKKLA